MILYIQLSGGEGGIRTHGNCNRPLDFEASTFGHSVTSPIFEAFKLLFITDLNGAYLRRTALYFRHSGMFLAGIQPEKL